MRFNNLLKIIASSITILVLSACGGNELGLDEEKVENATKARAIKQNELKEKDYKEADIEVVKVCEAVRIGEEEYGFDGEYLIFWQTTDGDYKRQFVMEDDYEVGYGTQRLEPIEDRCHIP